MEEIKGIIFDYGGTIDCFGDHWATVIRSAYSEAGVELPLDDFIDAYVYAERELARTRHILPEHNFGDMMVIKVRIELQYLAEHSLIEECDIDTYTERIAGYCYRRARSSVEAAKPTLDYLAGRYPMVLVTNFYGNVSAVLEDFGLGKYFKAIVESAVVGVRKPDPAIFTLGVEALGLKPEETVVIGDSLSKDIYPALKAGCKAVWIKGAPWFRDTEEKAYEPTIRNLDELREMF